MMILPVVLLLSACAPTEYWIPPSSGGGANVASANVASAEASFDQPTETAKDEQVTDPVEPPADDPEEPEESQPDPELLAPTSGWAPTTNPRDNQSSQDTILYYTQAADTLPAVAFRFGVTPASITSTEPIPPESFLKPGQLLIIPRRPTDFDNENTTLSEQLLPDSEFAYSPSASNFDTVAFVESAGGKLGSYSQWQKSTGFGSGAEILQRVAIENSINPRLLLALLEYESGWVYGQPTTAEAEDYPLGYVNDREKGLYRQLVHAVNLLSTGYYAWREGRLSEIAFPDGSKQQLAPTLNAGTAALYYYFSQRYDQATISQVLDSQGGFPALHQQMFGDPWERARIVEPLYPADIHQPPLILPFQRNWVWAFTGGPHGAWERDGAFAALDFAPGSTESGCVRSMAWVVAATDGLVTRSGNGVVVLDLDGDGYEQTGWVLVYLHVSTEDRIPVGSWVGTGDQLGHPSCEGGISTGTHLHIARKYNGEWVPAVGPIPFNLGGWVADSGGEAYKGTMVRDGQTVTASTSANNKTFLERTADDP